MQDRTINAALLLLRARIIRGDGVGREHVEALLGLRGVPLRSVWPGKRPDAASNGTMKRLLLAALRNGPRHMCDLVSVVTAQRPDLGRAAVYRRTDKAVQRLRVSRVHRARRADGAVGVATGLRSTGSILECDAADLTRVPRATSTSP